MAQKNDTPTLAEVARIAGVSQMTVSRALNNRPGVSAQKREEIQRIADDLGYAVNRAAQRLSGGRTRTLGVVAQLHSLYTSEIVLGIGSAGRAAGYEMLVYSLVDADRRPPGDVLELLKQFADGVIVVLPFESDYLATLTSASVPIVTIDQGASSPFPTVIADNYEGARAAMRHLADLGHRRIAFITGNGRLASARERLRAFQDMREQLGLSEEEAPIAEGNFLQKGGFEAARQLLARPQPPTAIFAANDVSAAGAVAAAREAGLRVPDDLSVMGFDDTPLAGQLHPTLTTIRQPMREMARAAVNLLLAMIAGIEPPTHRIVLPTELVARQSTAPPPAGPPRRPARRPRDRGRSPADPPAGEPAAG
ncbi:LacI family DNA-binding transcriptional regulator [Methylobacterium sp. JK268]